MLDPTVAIDDVGKIVMASASVESVFGWSAAELLGRNIKMLMPEPHRGRHDEYLANYRRTGSTNIIGRTREFEVVRKDGRRLVCELSVARAEMPGNAPPLFIGSFRDVTERRAMELALEDSERRFRAIFESSYEFMGLLQPDGTLLEVNRAALETIRVTREQVIGRKFWDTAWWSESEEQRERLRRGIADAAQGTFVRFETSHRRHDGELLVVDFSLNPVRDRDGRVVLIIPEGRDISEAKRAQQAETAVLRTLATIGESAAMFAHEIKNPITAVNVALRAVANQLGEDESAVLTDLVGRMQRLEVLMRRTLSFAKPLELRLATIDARGLIADVVRALRSDIVQRGAEVTTEVEGEVVFEGDRQLLDETLTNLLKNALEAAPKTPRIAIGARRTAGGGVLLAVDDDGPGISDSAKSTLFKPFMTTKPKGTGLGLAFCRKVVGEHGGTIEAKTSPLGGARFEVRLPRRPNRP